MPSKRELVDMVASVTGAPIDPDEYDGFLAKETTVSTAIGLEKRKSNQYHIAVTGPAADMLLFPLVTSSAYNENPDSDEKGRYYLQVEVRLLRPNLAMRLEEAADDAGDLAQEPAYYQSALARVEGSDSEWVDAFTHVTYQRRDTGQQQLEVGRSTDHQDFIALRRSLRPGDLLIFLRRGVQSMDVFAIRSDEIPEGDWVGSEVPSNRTEVLRARSIRTDERASSLGDLGGASELGHSTEAKIEEVVTACYRHGPEAIIALAGVPGTGKSFMAALAADRIAGDPQRVRKVQFHPGYTYEEFVEGLRLDESQKSVAQPGIFLEWNQQALDDPANPYVLVIDELTRANLSAVLGELMTFIEYRGAPFTTPYGRRETRVASGLTILATYNPVDRSAVEVDSALLRRMRVIDCPPSTAQLREMLSGDALPDGTVEDLVALFDACESAYDDYETAMPFGHGIFASLRAEQPDLHDLWEHRIKHMLRHPLLDPHEFTEVIEDAYGWRDPSFTAPSPETDSSLAGPANGAVGGGSDAEAELESSLSGDGEVSAQASAESGPGGAAASAE